ncbi:cation efflux protein [Backusella circina FSU 941]|nr:cation efflux protein [Backusella circina FSU 941]
MMLSREKRIYCMLVITGAFFVVEIVIGYYVNSLALIADSFHMMNDLLSLCVGLWAIKVAAKTQWNPKYSYGWQRAEILGALVNGVFLLALCFTIFLDAIERFASPEPVSNPVMVLITGSAGLVANIVGLFLFHEHGHTHHDPESDNEKSDTHHHDHGHLNMKGIFLHVLGDALGNVGVIISSLIIWLTPYTWRFYFDPIVSIVITIIIFTSAVPLVRQTSFILLQGVPNSINIHKVKEELSKLDGIISVHEFHLWQLSDTKLIASLHVLLKSRQQYMSLNSKIRKLLHSYGVHSATIQPEFVDDESKKITEEITSNSHTSSINEIESANIEYNTDEEMQSSTTCLLRCIEDSCNKNACCPEEIEKK